MKTYFFEDLGKKFSLATINKIETDITKLESDLLMKKEIVRIANIRSKAKIFWNDMTIESRKDFARSKDEKQNVDKAKSGVSFESVGHLDFDQMSDFWRAIYLSCVVQEEK